MISGCWPSTCIYLSAFFACLSVQNLFAPRLPLWNVLMILENKFTHEHFYIHNFERKESAFNNPNLLWFAGVFLWFGIGGNHGRRVSLPFCSDDVDDVPSVNFVAPHHSSWVGSILHDFDCFWGLPKPVGHDPGKKAHKWTLLYKECWKKRLAFDRPFCGPFAFVLFCGLGLVAITVDEFLPIL